MTEGLSVLMETGGTYPFVGGGVSTWCDILVRELPQVDYHICAVTGDPNVKLKYELMPNVVRVISGHRGKVYSFLASLSARHGRDRAGYDALRVHGGGRIVLTDDAGWADEWGQPRWANALDGVPALPPQPLTRTRAWATIARVKR